MSIANAVHGEEYLAHLEARLIWRRALSDMDCRALAYEYKVHPYTDDECLLDAWAEYQHRFSNHAPRSEFVKKRSASAANLRKLRNKKRSN